MKIEVLKKSSLPFVDLGWVKMSDHFVATVGESAGQGSPWQNVLVLADATFAPHSRFPLHSHQNMEIISIVLSGTLTHHEPDIAVSIPHQAAQIMSAHQGMTHAEGNDTNSPVRMLQLWVNPREGTSQQIPGTYEVLGPFEKMGEWMQVTPKTLRQSVRVFVGHIDFNTSLELVIAEGKSGYLLCAQMADTEHGLTIDTLEGKRTIRDGDGAHLSSGQSKLVAMRAATVILIEQ